MANNNRLKAACLTVGLCTAWGASAGVAPSPQNVSGNIDLDPGISLNNTYFIYGYNTSGGTPFSDARSLGGFSDGGGTFSVTGINAECGVFETCNYSIVGQYVTDTGSGVAVSANESVAEGAIGPPADDFTNVFFGLSESELDTALFYGITPDLQQFFIDNFYSFEEIGIESTLLTFTDASFGGIVNADYSPVPLPPALLLFAPALGVLAAARRRGTKKS